MQEDEFWKLIDKVDVDAMRDGDEEAAADPLIDALAKLDERSIEEFEEQLALALYRLDGQQFADHAGESSNSGDGFLYARCFVVGCGQRKYLETLQNPSLMPKSLDDWFEGLLFASGRAWAKKTGKDAEDWDYIATVSYETGSNTSQW